LLVGGCNLAGDDGPERAGGVVGEGDEHVVALGGGERSEIGPQGVGIGGAGCRGGSGRRAGDGY